MITINFFDKDDIDFLIKIRQNYDLEEIIFSKGDFIIDDEIFNRIDSNPDEMEAFYDRTMLAEFLGETSYRLKNEKSISITFNENNISVSEKIND